MYTIIEKFIQISTYLIQYQNCYDSFFCTFYNVKFFGKLYMCFIDIEYNIPDVPLMNSNFMQTDCQHFFVYTCIKRTFFHA